MIAALLAVAGVAVAPCVMRYTNKAEAEVTVCIRHNGNAPGASGNKTLGVGESWEVPCRENAGGSWQSYFAVPKYAGCGWDKGCVPETGSCKHYPWVMGQGLGANGLWYGSIGANWDGAGLGFTGDYSTTYGIAFKCSSYNRTQFPDLACNVKQAAPTCTPNHPNYNRPNSGVVECDPDQTIEFTIVPLGEVL